MTTNLPLDADRLWADVMALADITDPARPFARRSFTPLFLEGRVWLAQRWGFPSRARIGWHTSGKSAMSKSFSASSVLMLPMLRPAALASAPKMVGKRRCP